MVIAIPEHKRQLKVGNPEDVADLMCGILNDEDFIDRDKEHLWAIHFNVKMKIKAIELVALGTIDRAVTAPPEIFRRAIIERSTRIVVVHNHPSGDIEPSKPDVELTTKLVECGKLISIPVCDHIIIAEDGKYYSMAEMGLINQ
jgi:DNA repair protein RadC